MLMVGDTDAHTIMGKARVSRNICMGWLIYIWTACVGQPIMHIGKILIWDGKLFIMSMYQSKVICLSILYASDSDRSLFKSIPLIVIKKVNARLVVNGFVLVMATW